MSKPSKYVWSFNRFLPQFGEPLSTEEYLTKNNSKYTVCQYYTFLEREYSVPLSHTLESIYGQSLNIPIDIINIITVYNSGGIIYDYTKSFEQYTTGNIVYMTPIILGYIETFLFLSIFLIMYLMHFQFKYGLFPQTNTYNALNTLLLTVAMAYSLTLCIHTICVFISYNKCKQYEVIIRHFKRSLYSNKNFNSHIQILNMKSLRSVESALDHDGEEEQQHISLSLTSQNAHNYGIDSDVDIDIEMEEDGMIMASQSHTVSSSDIMDRWQWTETYKASSKSDTDEYLSILNPSNNSFAYVAYQRWLNVKKLELENDSFTRSKSALVLNLSKYWLTSYFTFIIILIFVIPNSVYLYFAFVLTLFVMYYCYLRTIKNLEHAQALKKVLYLFCSFVIGTIITLIIIFTTEEPNTNPNVNANTNDGDPQQQSIVDGTENINGNGTDMNPVDNGVTFWIFDVIFPVLEGIFAVLYSYITVSLVYKIVSYGNQGYHLWLCCVNAFGFWLLTFWIPSWKITEISIASTLLLLTSCYLYLQQISHRIMTGLNKQDYINKHCVKNPKLWLKNEIKQLFVPYTYVYGE